MNPLAARLVDLLAALFVLLIVGCLLIPLPLPLLDLLLALNLALALLLLATALLLEESLGLSTFPTLLLVSTLFRLALNVSSTRQILGQGEAGEIIEAFGAFVVGGSTIVGAVVFVILTVIQLVVVAKGAERVAEVGARFTLDGLPGKQLSIDADIRSGGCTQAEGAQRRTALEEESRFYGALDGAMKFVKGDAIAGLLITGINIVGGLGIGVGVHGLGLAEAASRFTLLSIGDGLLSQLPALLSSVAAGIVVTRVARSGARGGSAGEVARQLVSDPRALGLTIFLLLLLGGVPGLPLIPFFLAALLLGGLLVWTRRHAARERARNEATGRNPGAGTEQHPGGEIRQSLTSSDAASSVPARTRAQLPALILELGPVSASSDASDPEGTRALHDHLIPTLRGEFEQSMGFRLPALGLREIPPGHLRLLLHGAVLHSGPLPEHPLLQVSSEEARLLGIDGRPCSFAGREAVEINEDGIAIARRCGLTVQTPGLRLQRILARTLRTNAAELLTLQGAVALLEASEAHAPALIEEIRARISPSQLHLTLRRILDGGLGLAPLEPLLEALLAVEPSALMRGGVARARQALGRQLVRPHLRDGHLPVVLLDPLCDARLREALVSLGDDELLALDPGEQSALLAEARRSLEGCEGVLLVPSAIRGALAHLLAAAPASPDESGPGRELTVLAFEELPRDLTVLPLARLSFESPTPPEAGPRSSSEAAAGDQDLRGSERGSRGPYGSTESGEATPSWRPGSAVAEAA